MSTITDVNGVVATIVNPEDLERTATMEGVSIPYVYTENGTSSFKVCELSQLYTQIVSTCMTSVEARFTNAVVTLADDGTVNLAI